ncbi:DUF317 domain-containing protein [Streptomyces polygonati]|uniref:DUF317 domain-containing protein n=1 Tax=Streptomyces polygonati TaxID=1617087 RepID=A0ABV8HVY4_9ACTN
MSTQQPDDQPVLVSPAYLAGRGNPAAIGNALYAHRDWGWTSTEAGQIFVSPHHDVHVAYLPNSRDGGWRITRYHEPLGMPVWSASFSRNTPTEITSAFTDALVECLESDHPHPSHFGPDNEIALPADVLAERGWRTEHSDVDLSQHSPDGRAYFSQRDYDVDDYTELKGDGRAMWTMYARVDGVDGERWHADFTSCTPLYLLTETARAFSSTEPVERPRSGIPERKLPYVTTTPAPEPDPDRRQSAALARTPHTHPAAAAPPPGPATSDPVPPVPFRRR